MTSPGIMREPVKKFVEILHIFAKSFVNFTNLPAIYIKKACVKQTLFVYIFWTIPGLDMTEKLLL